MLGRPLMLSFLLSTLLWVAAPTAATANDPNLNGQTIGESGLPLPRFASLKFEEVNTRNGPGKRYPIRWVYKQKSLPIEIIEEFDLWRKIKDNSGDGGWVHKSQLSGVRTVSIKRTTALRKDNEPDAVPLIRASKDVIGSIIECDISWCYLQIDSYKGWLPKTDLWGVYAGEIIED